MSYIIHWQRAPVGGSYCFIQTQRGELRVPERGGAASLDALVRKVMAQFQAVGEPKDYSTVRQIVEDAICSRVPSACFTGTRPQFQPAKQSAPEPEGEFPSLLKQAISFGKAVATEVADVVKRKVKGKAFAKQEPNMGEIQARRLAVCQTCDQYKNGRCLKCGCVTKFKAAMRTGKCPLNKWPV